MTFAAPALLALLPLALAPVLVHLLYKRRRATIDLPTLRLLRHVELRLSPRRKLREILLLACRCLFVALLVLAVARPVLRAPAGGAGGSSDYFVLLDNTGSMRLAGRQHATDAFGIAVRRAQEVLDTLRPGDRAALLPLVEPAGWTAGAPDADRAALRRALESLECSDATADPAAALARARALADASTAAGAEIVVLSDFCGNWRRTDPPAGVLLVDCSAGDPPANVALSIERVEPRAPLAGRPVEVEVRLENGAAEEVVRTVTLELSDAVVETAAVTVPASGSARTTLLVPRAPGPGWCAGRVRLAPDGFQPDDAADFVLRVRDRLRAVVVDPALEATAPDPEASGRFLARLLDPAGDGSVGGIEARRVAPGAALPDAIDALLVCGYRTLESLDPGALRRLTKAGGLLAVFAEEGDTAAARADLAASPRGAPRLREPPGGVRFVRENAPALDDLAVRRQLDLRADAADAETLLEFDDGSPALVVRPLQNGYALSAGFGLGPAWGTFTFHPRIVALLHRLVARWARAPRIATARAGDRVKLPAQHAGRVTLERDAVPLGVVGGDPLDLGPLLRAGLYALAAENEAPTLQRFLAVRPAPEESDFARRLPESRLVGPGADLETVLDRRRTGNDLAPALLAAAFLLGLAEALLANRARARGGRDTRSASRPDAQEAAA